MTELGVSDLLMR